MSRTTKLGFLGRFTIMYFVVVLVLCAFSPLFQVTEFSAASADVTDTEKARAVTGHVDYKVDSTFPSNILGVNAVYYDYISDQERESGGKWLYPQKSGTGHNGSADDWYPFYDYNKLISDYAKSNPSWSTPLYFGNFCNTSDAYPNGTDHDSWGWDHVTGDKYGYKFNYPANNSNGLPNYNVSYQGLVHDSLVNNQLYVNSSVQAPYFNNDWLHNNNIAKIIEGEFPFTITEENGYKKYSFTSKNAQDNVYFTWENSGSGTYPTKVNYGKGSSFGVDDGIKYFMHNGVSSKGIFPFNNASSTNKGNKDSNENLNYGFGIRMDIDFRVPKDGLIPGTNTPIKFEFTGDDDLWVYITDNKTGKSQLVLDMGGAHKESHGTINFNTKTSTVDYVYDDGSAPVTGTRYVYLSKDNTGWSNSNTYAYFFDKSGDVGNKWPGYKMSTYGDGNNLRVAIPSGATHVIFNNNAGAQTGNISLADSNGAFWLDSGLGVHQWEIPPTDAGLSSVAGGYKENVTNTFEFDNSSDQNTYTMTAFYMERGLIESNMSISFTMTPLTNDLEVTKSVSTANVNSGLADELKNNEEFTYTIYNDPDTNSSTNNHAVAKDKAYTHTNTSGTTGSDGKFYLKDKESVRFDSQFSVGTGIKVVENETSKSGLSYQTSYVLTDKTTGDRIASSDSATSKFDFINYQGNVENKTSLKLDYTNTPKVAPITVTKKVVDENNNNISSNTNAEFTYNIALDLYQGDKYNNNLPLEYTKYNANGTKIGTYITNNGTFKLKGGQRAEFAGIPVGTKYKITEEIYDGYLMSKATINSAVCGVSGNTVSASVTTDQNVEITNTYKPSSASLKAYKTLEGKTYSGDEFTFRVSGLASKTVAGVTTVDTSSKSMTSNNCINGSVTFSNTSQNEMFTYAKAGTYCYKIEEVKGTDEAYVYDDTVYYAKVVVTSSSGNLSTQAATYYLDAGFTSKIDADDVKFENRYSNSEVRIVKKNFNGTKVLKDAQFMLYAAKTDSNGNYVIDESSDFTPMSASVLEYDKEYYARFSDVPKGEYIVVETKAPQGYELSDEQLHITVARNAQNNGVLEFSINDTETSKLPNAGGKGSAWILLLCVSCLSLSVMFLKHYDSKKKKAYCTYTNR